MKQRTCSNFFGRPTFHSSKPIILLDCEPASADVADDVHPCLLSLHAYMGGGRQECGLGIIGVRPQQY